MEIRANRDRVIGLHDETMPYHFLGTLEMSKEYLTLEQFEELASLLVSYKDVFAKDGFDLGAFTEIEQTIYTGNAKQ
ncbi:hypothetical protein DPMN_031901 [Dreissena polymorpha]|uniref:Uncharacterized protein n=1 Tax=Dreissena polymorpha TaxID=45954 RepID=A0A9D4M3N3_DREPO|nr:hypothetical protein DPMN_031901 [Dreissena polymorpha]